MNFLIFIYLLNFSFMQDETAATDNMVGDGTKANVSDHHMNDVSLEPPVVDVS